MSCRLVQQQVHVHISHHRLLSMSSRVSKPVGHKGDEGVSMKIRHPRGTCHCLFEKEYT